MSQRKSDHHAIATDDLFAGCHVPAGVAVGKRAVDVAVALFGLLATAPLWPVLVLLNGRGALFSRLLRVGRVLADRTELFMLLGFRGDAGPVWAMLRRARIDELPQLLNLLRGDVSLVGPRPQPPSFYARLDRIAPCFADRMIGLRPGLTGISQGEPGLTGISPGENDDAGIVRRVELDAAYARDLASVGRWLRKDAVVCLRAVLRMLPAGR
jgi:lipopolysaccharide/colanic/teichoic acid biosynthesis glycosyltransferase